MGSLSWVRSDDSTVAELVRPWTFALVADSELVVAVPADEAVVVGAFQRSCDAPDLGLPVYRRASGGAALRLGPGTVFVRLALARVDALVPCTPDRILNRYVRPLLTAITRTSAKPARYFGRDWIAVGGRPVAAVGFGHEASSGCAVFEAVVSAERSFALSARPSFRGKEPAVLGVDPRRVADAISDAYRELATTTIASPFEREALQPLASEPAWEAVREEAIGEVAAGRDAHGVLRIGGELMASRDAVARLEELLASDRADVGAALDAALGAPRAVVFGVRSLGSIREAVLACRAS